MIRRAFIRRLAAGVFAAAMLEDALLRGVEGLATEKGPEEFVTIIEAWHGDRMVYRTTLPESATTITIPNEAFYDGMPVVSARHQARIRFVASREALRIDA